MLFSWWTISRICPFSSPRVMDMDGLSGCAGHKSDLADSLCFIIRDPVIHYSTPPPRLARCCVRHDCILGSVVSARTIFPPRTPQGTKVLNAAVVVNRSTDVGQRKTPSDQDRKRPRRHSSK